MSIVRATLSSPPGGMDFLPEHKVFIRVRVSVRVRVRVIRVSALNKIRFSLVHWYPGIEASIKISERRQTF